MIIRNKENRRVLKEQLFEKLKQENAFWSYSKSKLILQDLHDCDFIALVMRYLDLSEIDSLFYLFPKSKIKESWKQILVPEGEYLYTMNRFFAWYYFNVKNPDAYLKSIQTKHLYSISQ